nr:putative reverse transcriptase domain, viral movement protein [Tanacetum cinerariifolium]
MNPDHYQLTKEECEKLVSQGIIEPTTSLWACETFYVNRRSEQVHGKLILVINYQPLNHFLADDKFLLPQKKSLFQHLADAKVLSKFDLKSGFSQLDTRGLMARANGVNPNKIPYHVMWNISIWSKDHPDAYKWIEANGQWLYDNFDHCEVETSDEDDEARSLWSSDDNENFDPFEDDPTHPDARWSL